MKQRKLRCLYLSLGAYSLLLFYVGHFSWDIAGAVGGRTENTLSKAAATLT
jgi:hypothetical protein